MNHQDIIKEMKDLVGTREPLLFFEKMTDLFTILFDQISKLETELDLVKTNSALAIEWEPRVASDMLAKEITKLKRLDKQTYALEIADLQKAYAEDHITQNYASFCQFWQDTLGWHPFLDYSK
jgi:hypothetical protein